MFAYLASADVDEPGCHFTSILNLFVKLGDWPHPERTFTILKTSRDGAVDGKLFLGILVASNANEAVETTLVVLVDTTLEG